MMEFKKKLSEKDKRRILVNKTKKKHQMVKKTISKTTGKVSVKLTCTLKFFLLGLLVGISCKFDVLLSWSTNLNTIYVCQNSESTHAPFHRFLS